MAATTKVTITLPTEQLKEIKVHVGAGRTSSVSAFVKRAVDVALADAAGWRALLEEALEESGGPLTAKERRWADAILKPKKRPKGSKAA